MEGILISLVIGFIAGLLAGYIYKGSGFGTFGNILLGLFGSLVGSLLAGAFGINSTNIIGTILIATIGAIALLMLGNVIFHTDRPIGWLYRFPFEIPKHRSSVEIAKLIEEIMAHQEMMDKLQDKIFEAEKALEKSKDDTRANLERLIQEMKDLRREMSEKGESFAEKFKGQTADLIRRVSDMLHGDRMPEDRETAM